MDALKREMKHDKFMHCDDVAQTKSEFCGISRR